MSDRKSAWQAPPRPEWVATINSQGVYLDPESVIPLDERSLLDAARQQTGLVDFGGEDWLEPFQVLVKALQEEAELTVIGRMMARNDVISWLKNRLMITELLKQHPEILEQEVVAPVFIVGLPRSGTSILFELLSQDSCFGVPRMWEAMQPCPPPTAGGYASDARIELADGVFKLWGRVVPEFNTMHEMAGNIPAECGLIMASSFISDHICALHQTPSYDAWYAQADLTPAYEYHKTILKILQWRNPRKHWLLKAPAHQNFLDTLLGVYPGARIVQTHRDPIVCMASATDLMGALYYMRSDKVFDATAFDDFLLGEGTAQRLERVMQQRAEGIVPEANIYDSRYQDLMDAPVQSIEKLYAHFGMPLSDATRMAIQGYLQAKPKGKFGRHEYALGAQSQLARERALFRNYQDTYSVPDEV